MKARAIATLTTALSGAVALISTVASVAPTTALAAGPIACSQLVNDPASGLAGNPLIKSAIGQIATTSPGSVSYCKVSILYGRTADENINIVVGLPLNSLDGGSGGVQGAWNGRTQGLVAAAALGL